MTNDEILTIKAVLLLLRETPHNFNDRIYEAIGRLTALIGSK